MSLKVNNPYSSSKENTKNEKTLLAILVSVILSFAAEMCNPGAASGIPIGSCYNEGYVCLVTTESNGGVRFSLGKSANCRDTSDMEKTAFVTFVRNGDGTLNTADTIKILRPFLQEGPEDNVGALAVATNTAFIINAFNEKIKVRITYHRVGNVYDENSVRLRAIGKAP